MDLQKLMDTMSKKGIDATKISEITQSLQQDPSQAMKLVQDLDIDASLINELVKRLQQHPMIFSAMAKSLGFESDQIQNLMNMATKFGEADTETSSADKN